MLVQLAVMLTDSTLLECERARMQTVLNFINGLAGAAGITSRAVSNHCNRNLHIAVFVCTPAHKYQCTRRHIHCFGANKSLQNSFHPYCGFLSS
jgi:hypothetical protein